MTICEYLDFAKLDRHFYLLDTWGAINSHNKYSEDIYDIVKERFSKFENVKLIRGAIPSTLSEVQSQKIAYLAIDMNGFTPELEALKYFYDKIVPGGVIYFDDYGWDYPQLREVVNDFFSDKPETILNFASGNAIIVKMP